MKPPLQIATVGLAADALPTTAAFGPFEVQRHARLDDLAGADVDALVIAGVPLAEVLAWPALAAMALNSAVLVLADTPAQAADPQAVLPLLAAGVQDVLEPGALAAAGASLARSLRLGIERKRLDTAARRAYATDLSTGLPHHPQLLEHMSHLLALREREPAPMALIVLRVSGLAATAALLGEEAANVLRRKAAVRLRSALRASDVVASIGNDAFAVLLAWIDAPRDGERVAAKLVHTLQRPFSVAGREQQLQVALGLASYPEHGKDAESLLSRASAQALQKGSAGNAPGVAARSADRGPGAAANDG